VHAQCGILFSLRAYDFSCVKFEVVKWVDNLLFVFVRNLVLVQQNQQVPVFVLQLYTEYTDYLYGKLEVAIASFQFLRARGN
jgi:hypothetical protein